ncbi:MAG: hypothetical protein K2F83_00095, partial [Oscillospiraceae bacterium]|nr:hypothetical protein [Oscillospiraceae bacterium]
TANFVSIAGAALTAPNTNLVGNGQSLTVTPKQAHDEERVVVKLNPASDCYAKTITVTDSRGQNVPWQYAPGGIAFEMTPAHVTVTVVYAKLPDKNDPAYKELEAKLHLGSTNGTTVTYGDVSAMGSAVLTGPNWPTDTTHQTAVNNGSFQITVPPQGQTLTLEVTPNTGYHVTAAYAVKRGTGDILPLVTVSGSVTTSMPQVPNGGTVTFAMPDDDADVYVVFADDTEVPPPGPNDLTATLIVAGPTGSGSAVMHDNVTPVTVTTRNVDASGADSLYALQGTELMVDLTVNPGFGIAAIRVTDVYGNKIPYTWTDGTQRHFTLTMPAGGARVYVELEEVDTTKELTAQVVVNNGGGSGNKAVLRRGDKDAAGTITGTLLHPVYAGDGIWVDITVQIGYQIEYLKVVPAKYGIAPSLTKLPVLSQSTSFVMPGEDVVVYVKFIRDDRERKNVTLVAQGDEDTNSPIQNKATVSTAYSGTRGPVYPVTGPNSTTAQAAPPTATLPAEWVTVDYTWADGYYVTSITVVDSTGNPVPFTQNLHDKTNRTGQITFPMVDSDVRVTVTWGTELVKYPAVLHVIDLDNPAANSDSWGKLTWLNPPTGESPTATNQVYPLPYPEGTETLMVPAGEKVQVDADAQDGTYIQAAFVLYRVGGQMIYFNFTDPVPAGQTGSGHQQDTFVMHPGQNDVYIYYTRTRPNPNDHSAVLMLDSPAGDTTSTATIERTRVPGPDDGLGKAFDSVTANDPNKTHGYVNASQDDTITVTVNPAPGYIIDYILMTPLGIEYPVGTPIVPTRQPNGTYTFTMPNENVAVYVKLKKDDSTTYKAYLHYKMVEMQDDGSYVIKDLDITKDDWAQLSFDWGGIITTWNIDGEYREVPESATVTVGASITQRNDGLADYVLAAYVLKENGDMVPLSDALEGLTETHTTPDRSLLDGTSDFTMPGADVHAYVWFTNKKPAENWRTAVLTVFDRDPGNPANDNSGLNSATLESSISNKTPIEVWSTGVTGRPDMPDKLAHQFIWVTEGETVTVKTKHIEPGYSFVDATITHSLASATQPLTDISGTTPPPYVFTYEVEGYNSAVVVNYVKSELTRNPLNVVLIDRDNPGDGVVTNSARVTATGTATLVVASVTSAGARQRIPDVLSGTNIAFQVDPYAGYTAVARLKDNTGTVINTWPVGHYSDNFTMPNGETTLEIIYFRGHEVTLSIVDTQGTTAPVSNAQMTEDAFSLPAITADTTGVTGTYTALPAGTKLTASLTTLAAGRKLIGALAMDSTGTRWIAADTTNPNDFIYTLGNRDLEIRLVVGPENEDNYLATVSAVNLPTGTAAPQIHVTPTANPTEGPGWTVAVPADEVTVTVDVPYGYKAVLTTTDGVTLTPDEHDGTYTAVTGGTTTFTMPAHNVHVTVTYVKTRFTATIRTAGTGSGTADLTYDTTTVVAGGTPDTIYDLLGGEALNYTAKPDAGSTLTRILMTTAGGVTSLLTYADDGTGTDTSIGNVTMPTDDVTITVFFDDDNDRHYIAFVTVVDPDNDSDNAAQDIKNTTQNLGGGFLWAYGDEGDGMKVLFTVAPGYRAVVTAEYANGSVPPTPVPVTQQGGNNLTGTAVMNATATLIMPPNTDVKVTITYTKDPPEEYKLKLRLVGHGQVLENQATLYATGYGSTPNLNLNGTMAPDLNDLWSGNYLNVTAGSPLDLDAGRAGNYIIRRATIGLLDATGNALIPGTETDLVLNEYGTTATNLHYMPGADAVVTVYYRLPYQATLFVVDTAGDDYNDGMATPGPADTSLTAHDRTPTVTMSVDRTDLGPAENNPTTFTHTPIKDLNGLETVTTVVDLTTMPTPDKYGKNAEVASVIATTSAGTVHLLETALGNGEYKYPMTAPGRVADDVDITVILRDADAEDKMYTATVYKVGHDNKPGNTADIENSHTPTPPKGTIWTGAYEDDVPVVKVTTEPGYYAIVTAVLTGTTTPVPILQWVTEGTAANPIEAIFKMPAHDVDVTVEYVTEKPKADMTLTLEDHDGEEDNKGDLYNDPAAQPNLTTPAPTTTKFLWAKGDDAWVAPVPPATDPTLTNPYSVTTSTKVDVGDYLDVLPGHGTGYYIKSITFKAAGFTFDMLNDPTFIPRVPLSGGEVIIEFAPGKQSGRPYDPEHSERYNASTVWSGGNYITGDTTDGNPNPDLSVYPMEEQQGWILAESADATALTVVVTVPTLYDKDDKLTDSEALADAGVDPTPPDGGWLDIPPYYQFYWYDKDNSEFKQFTPAQLSVLKGEPLSYANNPKGDFPKGDPQEQHYGYRLTLKALEDPNDSDSNPLIKYIQDGGEIYVTATRPGYVSKDDPDDPDIPWVESEMTQVIIKSDNVLKPYDPDNEDNPRYEDHWITSENRGDYLLVTVPMLNNKAGDNPTEVDGTKHRLQLHLQEDGTDRDSDIVNVTELLNIVNVREYEHFWNVNLEYDPDWRTNGTHERTSYLYDETYENEIYNSDYQMPAGGWAVGEEKWHGARFVVEIKSDDEIDADDSITDKATAKSNAAILREIFDNDGTMGTNNYRMYITSDEVKDDTDPMPTFRKDDYTDFEVPRYYSLAGELQSWAPTHIAELMLYRADTSSSSYNGYELMPWLMIRSGLCETMSRTGDFDPAIYNERWSMSFAFKSSKMAGLTYQMIVEKTSHITYIRTEIELDTTYT